MSAFQYTARDQQGNLSSGHITGRTEAEVRQILRHKNLFATIVKEINTGSPGFSMRRKKVKLTDMVVMSRQLATLVRAGLSLVECLYDIAEQTENPTLAEALRQVRLDIMTGCTLTESMCKHPAVFNENYLALVQAGETGGTLEQTLETAAIQLDQEAELREKVKGAFVYPALVMISSFGVVIFMLVFIVPVFAKVYDQFHSKLPAITLLLVSLSHLILTCWWGVALAGAFTLFLIRKGIATRKGRRIYDTIKLKMPLLGNLNRKIAVARFTQTLGGMVKAGVPLLQALMVASQTSGNTILQEAVSKVAGFIKDGSTLSAPLEQSRQFPLMMTRMVAAGELSGNLDAMLEEVTHFYNRDIEYTVNKLTKLMEPLMTMFVGGIVLFILLALYMPVFNLTHVLRR